MRLRGIAILFLFLLIIGVGSAEQWGYPTVGASADYWAQSAFGYRFTAPADIGTLLSVNFYGKNGTTPQNLEGVIFTVSGTSIGSFVANSKTDPFQMTTTYGWYYGNFTAQPTLTAGNDYFIVVFTNQSPAATTYFKYDAGTAGYGVRGYANTYVSPSGITTATYENVKRGIYIEYIASGGGDTTPPGSLSSFSNTTTCSQTNISFTEPLDSDYNGYMFWWNGIAGANQTNATSWYKRTGLTGNTTYTLSTKTFDLTGNVNASFQNYSVTTGVCEAGKSSGNFGDDVTVPILFTIAGITCCVIYTRRKQ